MLACKGAGSGVVAAWAVTDFASVLIAAGAC